MSQAAPSFKLSSGRQIPFLAWGNGTGKAKQTPIESGKAALSAGIRHIDTAQGYENEKEAGAALKASGLSKEQVWVTSKLSQEGGAADKDPIQTSDVRNSVQTTIKSLGFQPDLLLVHNPFVPAPGELVAFWQELEKLKDSGELTADLGVSNFRPQDIEELLKVAKHKPVVNQLEYHPFVLTHLDPVLALHKKYGIVVESYGPLTPILRHPTKGEPLRPTLTKIIARLGAKSTKFAKSIDEAAVLLLWVYAKGVVAVSASGNEERIQKLGLVQQMIEEGVVLLPEEVSEIEEIGRKYHFRGYPEHMKVDFPAPNLPEQ